ncbi:MAG: hypothetical protein HOV78_11470 [Hamadaea sp.]|nr:hypothetical protein [Hamadaea sp.]
MLNLHRAAALLFPSVPPADRAVVLAAMEGRAIETPVTGVRGEAHPVAGHNLRKDLP